jgi:hypothetical protein
VPPDRGGDVVRLETFGELCGGAIDDRRTQPVLVAQHCGWRDFKSPPGGRVPGFRLAFAGRVALF